MAISVLFCKKGFFSQMFELESFILQVIYRIHTFLLQRRFNKAHATYSSWCVGNWLFQPILAINGYLLHVPPKNWRGIFDISLAIPYWLQISWDTLAAKTWSRGSPCAPYYDVRSMRIPKYFTWVVGSSFLPSIVILISHGLSLSQAFSCTLLWWCLKIINLVLQAYYVGI